MWLEDFVKKSFKIFRESTASVPPEYKANQGFEVTDQSVTTAAYTTTNGGDEQGWLYLNKGGTRPMGSWMMACPAIYTPSTGLVRPMKDKSQAVDTDYATKSLSSVAGDSSSVVRLASITGGGANVPGIIVACPNHQAQEQIFIPMATDITISYARIAWNYSLTEDLSEAEIMTYVEATNTFTASGTVVWIESWLSIPNLVFTTAGDGTLFEVQNIGSARRRNVTRDLYVAKKCVQDEGTKINYLQGIRTYADYSNALDIILSGGVNPWNTPENSAIRTTILTQSKVNNMNVRIADDWYGLGDPSEFKWARIQTYSPMIAAPIKPILQDRNTRLFTDYNKYANNQSISVYRLA